MTTPTNERPRASTAGADATAIKAARIMTLDCIDDLKSSPEGNDMKLREKRPATREWREIDCPEALRALRDLASTVAASYWACGRVVVLSTIVRADAPDDGRAFAWYVRIWRPEKRPTSADVSHALRAFGLGDAKEKQIPGAARHFYLPLDAAQCAEIADVADASRAATKTATEDDVNTKGDL